MKSFVHRSAIAYSAHRPSRPDPADLRLLIELARAFHAVGVPSHELEADLRRLANALEVDGDFFVTPTALFVGLRRDGLSESHLLRVEPGGLDLGRMVELRRLYDAALTGAVSSRRALTLLARPSKSRPSSGPVVTALAFALASAGAARVFDGGASEMVTALLLGTFIGLLAAALPAAKDSRAHMFEPLAALVASAGAMFAGAWWGPLSVETVTIAALIVLVPGLTLTQAIGELTARNLASGTARLMGSLIVFLTIAFGATLGRALAVAWVGVPVSAPSGALPDWTLGIALVTTAIAFAVLFKAKVQDLPWLCVSVGLALVGAQIGESLVGSRFSASVAALLLGLAANTHARLSGRPTTVLLVPGLIMLVPGSLGYRSLALLAEGETVGGVDVAFDTILVAVGLVAGLLTANALLPPRSRSSEPMRSKLRSAGQAESSSARFRQRRSRSPGA